MSWGALAGSIAGGLFGGKPSRSDAAISAWRQWDYSRDLQDRAQKWQGVWNQKQLLHARQQLQESRRQYNWQAKHKIQHAVNDAKRAGIHPLYALGASGATPAASPAFSPGGASSPGVSAVAYDSGGRGLDYTNIGRAAENIYRGRQAKKDAARLAINAQQLHDLEVRERMSRIGLNDAEATKLQSEAARGRQEVNNQPESVAMGAVELKPAEQVTKKRQGIEAGLNPAYAEVELPDGTIIRGPGTKLKEMLEDAGAIVTGWQYSKDLYNRQKPKARAKVKSMTRRAWKAIHDIQRYW